MRVHPPSSERKGKESQLKRREGEIVSETMEQVKGQLATSLDNTGMLNR